MENPVDVENPVDTEKVESIERRDLNDEFDEVYEDATELRPAKVSLDAAC